MSWDHSPQLFCAQHARPARHGKADQSRKAGLRSLAEPWADTTSSAGRTLLAVLAGMAKFERGCFISGPGRDGLPQSNAAFGSGAC